MSLRYVRGPSPVLLTRLARVHPRLCIHTLYPTIPIAQPIASRLFLFGLYQSELTLLYNTYIYLLSYLCTN